LLRKVVMAGVAGATLAAPTPVAVAADWYVATPARGGSDANTCSQAAPCATVQHVFSSAAVVDGDTVHVGPGEFPGRSQTSKRLTLEGNGAGTTTSFDPNVDTFLNAATTIYPAVEMLDGGTIRRVRAQGGFGGADTDLPAPGLKLRAGGDDPAPDYELMSVVGLGGAKATTGRPGLQVSDETGPGKPVSATVGADSYFQSSVGTGAAVLVQGVNVSASLTAVTAAGAAGGVGVTAIGGAAVSLTAVNLLDTFGQATAAQAVTNGELTINASTLLARTTGIYSSAFSAGATRVTIEGSLVAVRKETTTGGGYGVRLNTGGPGQSVSVNVRNSTVFASGPNVLAGVHAAASNGARAEATLANTAVQATDTDTTPGDADLVADSAPNSVASISASTSAFNDRLEKEGGAVTAPDSAGNVAGDARFTDPSRANFVPLAGSPLIDRANPLQVPFGALDLAGGPRAVDGDGDCLRIPDVGAYEAAEVTGSCTPRVILSGRPVRLTAQGLARVKASCPAGAPGPCAGTLTLRSAGKLKATKRARRRSIITFGSAALALASGETKLVNVAVSAANRAVVRRYGGVTVAATAELTDPERGPGTSRARFRLGPLPRRLVGVGGTLRMAADGGVRVKVSCPSWEIESCAGSVSLRTRHRPVATLGSAGATVRAGAARFVTPKLDATGRALVRRSGRLLARLVITSRDRRGNKAQTTRSAVIRRAGRS
jgi:hypothetical protein